MRLATNISLLLLMLCASLSLSAQVDRRHVRAGNRDFAKGNYKEADVDYRKALLKDSTSVAANYNLANTAYIIAGGQKALGNLDEAGKLYESVSEAASVSEHAADYWFNVGDLALAKKDYGKAVDAFKKSLLSNPGDIQAKENYIYAKLKQQEQEQNQQNQQDQNQDQNQNNDQQNQDQNNNQNNQNKGQDNQDQQGQNNQQPQMSPQAAQQLLQAIQAKEKETQDKVNKEKAQMMKSKQKEKNW